MKKKEWDQNSQHACGSTPQKCWQEDKHSTRKWRGTWRNEWCPLCCAWTGCVLVLSMITSGCQKALLPNMLKKRWTRDWFTRLVFRVWYYGASYGFQHLRGWVELWKNNIWKLKSITRLSRLRLWTQFRKHLVESTNRDRACCSCGKGAQNTHRVESKQGDGKDGWFEGVLNSYPLLMMMTAMNAVMNDWNHRKPRHLPTQGPCTEYPFLLRALHFFF